MFTSFVPERRSPSCLLLTCYPQPSVIAARCQLPYREHIKVCNNSDSQNCTYRYIFPEREGGCELSEQTEGLRTAKEPPYGGSLPTALTLPILGSFCMKVYQKVKVTSVQKRWSLERSRTSEAPGISLASLDSVL